MKISIVVPAYNAVAFLAPTLDSAIAQTFTNWAMTVVDDGSKDNTADVVRDYADRDPRIRLHQQANGGLAAARNSGIAASDPTSDLFIFLDADDLWAPDALESLLDALNASPNAVAAHALSKYIDEHGADIMIGDYEARCRDRQAFVDGRIVDWPTECPTTFETLIAWNCIGNPGLVLIRRLALERVGEFDKLTNPSEDYDMWLRLSRLGEIAYVDRVLLAYRRHGANMSGNEDKMRQADLYVRAKAAAAPTNTPAQRRAIHAAYRTHQMNLVKDKLRLSRQELTRGKLFPSLKQCVYSAGHLRRYLRGLPTV